MSRIRAYVESIIYQNSDNHYTVLSLSEAGESFTAVGYFPYIDQGDTIEAEGNYTIHPVYGKQFSVESYTLSMPDSADAIERYLAAGAIKGIGEALAKRIVKSFGDDTFRIMEEEPERLSEIKGISERMARSIYEQTSEKKGLRDAVIFMQSYGIGPGLANRIYEKYGPALYGIIRDNPYRLADDIEGIGFRLSDSIAKAAGMPDDSPFRIKCALQYVLRQALSQGHTYLPKQMLLELCSDLLGTKPDDLNGCLMDLQIEGRIVVSGASHEDIYLSEYYRMEQNTALMLKAYNIKGESEDGLLKKRLSEIQSKEHIELDEKQAEAVKAAVENGIVIITGGPGTGKTTTINTIIRYFDMDGMSIALCAPTGRAAKRMSEATGCEAKTIHRLLEYTGMPGEKGGEREHPRFLKNENDPLDQDVVIVDEMSMTDIFLMDALLKAITPGTRLILVGDKDQLPSVGAGNVLCDLIDSECLTTVRLEHIFRQAAMSDIVVNAHRINHGKPVDLSKKSRDFLFIKSPGPEAIISAIKKLLTDKLPGYVGAPTSELQVLTPTRKGALGVESLNIELQAYLNPASKNKPEIEHDGRLFRVGDKVMQIKNDYDLSWTRRDSKFISFETGAGVFNGDIGVIYDIDSFSGILTVVFDDDRYTEYDKKHLSELELAYAVTVHKSQGSEYPAVIMPMYPGPHMLMNKNLLYTAVTRARRCVCMVGLPRIFEEMEHNENESRRFSGLRDRLMEVYGKAPIQKNDDIEGSGTEELLFGSEGWEDAAPDGEDSPL
ncbi:MAG TPA: ATP-dependent RecD-like DNA helicase [Candidatus Avilachnospira avicola]|nr:ATP-dependent RecD-like DNA helicase [Candidatus Avilachnospira avicola]